MVGPILVEVLGGKRLARRAAQAVPALSLSVLLLVVQPQV